MSLYQIRVEDIHNQVVELSQYQGQVLLIVNTATKCFFTPQYEGLESLQQQFHDKGFEVLDFPCNQFGENAPESIEDIDQFCVDYFKTSFKRFQKIEVNGHERGFLNRRIKWNFTKFLIDRNGRVIKRYSPRIKPSIIAKDIEKVLANNDQ